MDYCDERCQEFVRSWAKAGRPLPVVGFELQDGKGRICGQAELAWPQHRVAAMFPEDEQGKASFEQQGWTVFDAEELAKHESELRTKLGV